MARVFDPLMLFLSPFVLYALYLAARARWPLAVEHWSASRTALLALLGLAAAVGGFVALDAFAPRGHGAYVPAHVVNGVLVPGRFE